MTRKSDFLSNIDKQTVDGIFINKGWEKPNSVPLNNKKPLIKMNYSQKPGLLYESLRKTENLKIDDKGFIQFSMYINPEERENALALICKSYDILERVGGENTTFLELAPSRKSADEYLINTLNDKRPKLDSVSPMYSMKNVQEIHRWDSPYRIEHYDFTYEHFSSTLVIFNKEDEVIGTLTFTLSLFSSDVELKFQVDLELVYVRPQFRRGTNGLDLTIGVMKLSTAVYRNLISVHKGIIPIDIVIHADYVSRSGKRLATLVSEEFKDEMHDLNLEASTKNKVGSLSIEIYD